jgi:hypothetical protein
MFILAAALATAGCATSPDFRSTARQALKNDQGHVIGYKNMLRDRRTGEVSAQVALFAPIRNDAGEVIGYEEQTRSGGAIIRDLQGHAIGGRFVDLRSRQTNARSRGVTIVIGSLDSRRVVARQEQFVAALSAEDLRALR